MRRFAALYLALDASTATEAKVSALVAYLAEADAADAAWAVYLLAGGKPRQTVPTAVLRQQAQAVAGLPDWLFEACYQAVGDLAETIALVLPEASSRSAVGLAEWMTARLLPLRGASAEVQAEALRRWWDELAADERFLLTKLIGGGFRVGVSRGLVERALARHAGLDAKLVAQRMMGYTDGRHHPAAEALQALLAPADSQPQQALGQPYPFYLAHPLPAGWQPERQLPDLGEVATWQAEWKYDGVRAQLVRRAGQVWLWSRGEDLMAGRFPEVEARGGELPDGTVLDGELLVWLPGQPNPAPFQRLQQRLQRKTVGRKLLAESPVVFIAYDLLEVDGLDQRDQPFAHRRERLQRLLADGPFTAAPPCLAGDWAALAAQRQQARALGVEGLMLKHRDAPYGVGRSKAAGLAEGGWWKWKLDPLQVDGVLVYAQAGHGRRAGLYTDYTFAVWNRAPASEAEARAVVEAITRREPAQPGALQLVAFAKAYSGLSDDELRRVDQVIRQHTLEKFGPVRSVRPTLVVTLGFEGIQPSRRHRSGVALRFPRILRLRPDKPVHEADVLATLQALVTVKASDQSIPGSV
jgi:DNA ligase 1